MKITIEFDPGELARSAAGQVVAVAPDAVAAMSFPSAPQMAPGMGTGAPIDAGHAPGAGGVMAETMAGTETGAESVPAEIAAAAAAIGAVSAGPAPALD
jgi:hypothetical protein